MDRTPQRPGGEDTLLPPAFDFWMPCFLHVWIGPRRVHQEVHFRKRKESLLSKDKAQRKEQSGGDGAGATSETQQFS